MRPVVWLTADAAPAPAREMDPTVGLRILASWFLYLYIFTIPWEDQWLLGTFGTFSRLAGIVAMGAGIFVAVARAEVRMPMPTHALFIVFLAWGAASLLWTMDFDLTWIYIQTYAQQMGVVWLIYEFAPGLAEQRRVFQAYVLGTLVSSADTILNYLDSTASPHWQRYVATGFDPNDLCVILAMSLPLSFYLSVTGTRGRLRWLWYLHPIPVVFAAALTASRGGLVAVAVSLAIVPLLLRNTSWLRRVLLAVGLIAAIGVVIFYTPASSFERLSTLPSDAGGRNLGDRMPIWEAGWEMFRERPVAGVGLGAFESAVSRYLGYSAVAHNAFLTVLAELGAAGFAILCVILGSLAFQVARMESTERRLWGVLLATWVAGSLSLSWAHRKATWLLFGLLVAQSSALLARREARRV